MEQQLVHIQNLIYEVRGKSVMLDFDLAMMYQVETKNLKRAVRRNIERFPSDFMFELTKNEWELLRCQIGTLKNEDTEQENLRHQFGTSKNDSRGQHPKYLPYAFTEQGVAMLSGLLNSNVAIQVNIIIMRAFVAFRQLLLSEPDRITKLQIDLAKLKMHIDNINEDTQKQIDIINETLTEMQTPKLLDRPRQKIGYFTEEQIKNKENIFE